MHAHQKTKSPTTPHPTPITLTLALALAAAYLSPHTAHAQIARFSLQGFLDTATTDQPFPFTLSREVTAAEATAAPNTIKFVTLHHSGGTNDAGVLIPAGSFDPELELRDSTDTLIAFNQDSGTGSDARLNFATGSPPIPAPIGPGDFTLNMLKAIPTADGPWALDIRAPSDAITLTLPGTIGPAPGTPGLTDVVVFQPGAQWQVPADLNVGDLGTGTLTINDGANVSNTNGWIGAEATGNGHVSVDGGTWTSTGQLTVGNSGTGSMAIANGANVFNTLAGVIGAETGSIGTATVNDGGTWTNDLALFIGFQGHGTLTINTGANVSNTNGWIGAEATGNGHVSVDGGTWTNTGQLSVGNFGTGSMTINNGANVSNSNGWVGNNDTGNGHVSVDGGTWINTGQLSVGRLGTGSMTINNGASVTNTMAGTIAANPGTTGTVTVNDGGTWTNDRSLSVGFRGHGTLTINTGANVSNTNGLVGHEATGNGHVSVDGGTWTSTGQLIVGRFGTGSMTINNGANVFNTLAGFIGARTGSTGIVTVNDGGTWNNTNLFVGGSDTDPGGTGTLTVKDSALVDAGDTLKIWNTGQVDLIGGAITAQQIDNTDAGTFNWFTGTVNITGASGLTLSPDNIGTNITLDHNRALNVTNTLTVPTAATLTVAGGGLNVGAATVQPAANMIAANTTINLGAGLTNQSNLTLIDTTVNGPVTSPAGSAITVVGTVNFNDLVSGAAGFFGPGTAVFNAGHNPGDSPAAVNIEGNLTYTPTNTLYIELAGTIPGGEHDQLNISGDVTLDGTLDIQPLDAYTPTLGDTFNILTYNTRTPDTYFDTITNTLIDTTLALAPLLDDTTNQLTLRATIPGDLNLDNKVSVADLAEFALNFDTTPGLHNETDNQSSWLYGDFNTDGAITVADLSLLALNFGFDATDPTSTTLGFTPAELFDAIPELTGLDPLPGATVPEPTTALLYLIIPILFTNHRTNNVASVN